jgi:hypothetical protein
MHWSDCNDTQRTLVLQTVLVAHMFSSIGCYRIHALQRPRMHRQGHPWCVDEHHEPGTPHAPVHAAASSVSAAVVSDASVSTTLLIPDRSLSLVPQGPFVVTSHVPAVVDASPSANVPANPLFSSVSLCFDSRIPLVRRTVLIVMPIQAPINLLTVPRHASVSHPPRAPTHSDAHEFTPRMFNNDRNNRFSAVDLATWNAEREVSIYT